MFAHVIKTEPTTFYLGVCNPCTRPVREEHRGATRHVTGTCLQCDGPVRLERLVAVTSEDHCNGACECATGPNCSCSCGGANHGRAWGGGYITHTHHQLESHLEAYRARVAKLAEQRQRKAELAAAKRRNIFTGWAEDPSVAPILAQLATIDAGDGTFLSDMKDLVGEHKLLTERQLAATDRAVTRILERRARIEHQRATAQPAPLGKALVVEGVVTSAKAEDNPFSRGLRCTMVVDCGTYRVFMTIPRSLSDVNATTQGNLFGLRGKRVRLVADLGPAKSGDDPSFAIGTRPRNAEILGMSPPRWLTKAR